ncbi:helix-hairpin-helix domain-containing protein [Subtercola endophyticus]|uniref:helix-hairpin-helix domain-containing protein n=1 Tax=Subtercola endophyticus TaxID=2895559 RepID=UPI001E432254|nr:helix-hairpin-helix domain-containing protein [Subtercola endophyticus]UFS60758.1 helix-hairpin-helix domain-containing protein [Subtercola endophyticus]
MAQISSRPRDSSHPNSHSADTSRTRRSANDAAGAAAEGPPTPRSRVRIGVGAALVVVLVALVCAVLISLMAPRGRTDTIALAAAGTRSSVAASMSTSASASTSTSTSASAPAPEGDAAASGSANASASPAPRPVSGSGSPAAVAPGTAPVASGASSAQPQGATGAVIMVHVTGYVQRPGVYELHQGDRVIDAVTAAGGFAPTADQSQLNLARALKDGEQVVIPEVGAAPPPGSVASAASSASGASGASGAPSSAGSASASTPVNLNSADEPTLETLPHVGPAMAAKIIAWRTENGPFTQIDDLKNVSGIGDKTFAELEPLVTV